MSLYAAKSAGFHNYDGSGKWQQNKPWKTVPAVVQKIIKSVYPDQVERIEISIPAAEDLFREIRIENTLTDVDGQQVALKTGARLNVTFEAEAKDTVRKVIDHSS